MFENIFFFVYGKGFHKIIKQKIITQLEEYVWRLGSLEKTEKYEEI